MIYTKTEDFAHGENNINKSYRKDLLHSHA